MSPSSTTAQPRHIAVVGGGIIGASTLYYLARDLPSNVRVTLIEEAPTLAPAASGKSGGFLALDWHGADTSSLAALSYALHAELAKRDGGEQKWGYRQVDTLSIKFDEAKARNKCPDAIKTWIDGKHVSSASDMGGNGTTAQATPLPLVMHLVEQSKKAAAVDVLCSTRAQRLTLDGATGRVNGLVVKDVNSKEERTLDVQDVVIAAGPWTGTLLKSLLPADTNAPRYLRNAMRISGSRAHSIVVQAPQPTTAHCLFTDMSYTSNAGGKRGDGHAAGAPEVYCRGDGTVYACGGSDEVPLPAAAVDVKYDAEQTARLVEQVAHLSPSHLAQSAGAKIAKEQACYLPIAAGSPIVAGDAKTGIWVAAGHSCWGITLGLGTGKVMREMLLGEPLSADIGALR